MRASLVGWVIVLLTAACAPQPGVPSPPAASAPTSAAPRRIVASVMDEPAVLSTQLSTPAVRGIDAIEELIHAGLTVMDREGTLRPQLAEAAPTLENGQWKLLPDGRMETTWRIKSNARWQDGTAFTSADLVFTAQVAQDRDVGVFREVAHDATEQVTALDERAVAVSWRRPYIAADRLFTRQTSIPLPKHILEPVYVENRAGLAQAPYFGEQFVGAGPFRVKEWARGSYLLLEAFDQYVLGRPNIDEIEVRFIPDPNTLAANVLAGSVELTLGRGLDLEQALRIREQWGDGTMEVAPLNWLALWPQLLNPQPAVLAEVQFRRALLHAADRQQLVDSLMGGFSSVAHSYVSPDDPAYKELEHRIVRYDYDPRRAAQIIEGLGYSRGPDGVFRDGAGQRLGLEMRTTAGDLLREKVLLTVADDWQRVGVAADPVIVPRQRAQDQEYRATFPAFELVRQPNSEAALASLHSRAARLPENNYVGVGGTNYARYMSTELDALIDRYFVTIPRRERTELLAQIARHISEQLNAMGLFYAANPSMISYRLKNVRARSQHSTETWNAHEWRA